MNVSIVGPERIYPARKNLKIGDKLTFKKVLSSEFGKTVEVYDAKGEQVGFVAAKTSTAESGTYLADEIFDNERFGKTFIGVINNKTKTGRSIVFIAEVKTKEIEIKEENKMGDIKEKDTVIEVDGEKKGRVFKTGVVGPKRLYPHRYAPSKKIRAGESVPAQLDINNEEQKIVVSVDIDGTWQPCGYVTPDKLLEDSNFKTYTEIMSLMNMYKGEEEELPEIKAEIVGLDTRSSSSLFYILEVTIFGQTAIEQLTDDIKEYCALDEDKFEDLKNFLETLNVSEKVIIECFKMLKDCLPQDPSRIPSERIFNNYDEVVEDVLYSIVGNGNTMLSGPMAAGKNTLLEMLAYKFDKALYEIQVNSYIDNDVLLGTKTIKAKDSSSNKEAINEECRKLYSLILCKNPSFKEALEKADSEEQIDMLSTLNSVDIDFSLIMDAIKNGDTEIGFLPSALVVAMEKGSWVVIDEFNTGQASVMSVLNSVLDDRKRIQVPGYGLIQAAPGFRLFATMNPEYEGTFTLNPATASRFNFVLFKASDKIAPIILTKIPSADKSFLNICEKIYKKIRDGIESGKLQENSINIRGFVEAAKMVELGRPAKRALLTCVANGISDADDRNAIHSYIEIEVA